MKSWTVAEMLAERPCYSEARIRELWAGRERLTLREILDLDIPPRDRMWVVHRPSALTPEQQAQWCLVNVQATLKLYGIVHHVTQQEAVGYLSGKSRPDWVMWIINAALRDGVKDYSAQQQIADTIAILEVTE